MWRTVVMYGVVLLVLRLMGKREIGKLSVLDLVVSVIIADIAVIEIEEPDNNLMHGIWPIFILLFIQIVTAFITMKNRTLRLFFDGKPSIIIANGEIMRAELKKQRYNLDDLMLQLRENSITSVDDVEFAILETSGKLSVIPKSTTEQSNDKVEIQSDSTTENQKKYEKIIPAGFRYEMLPIPLIMDGKVQDTNLEKLQKTRFWLKNIIQEKGASTFKEVLLCTIDHRDHIYVDLGNRDR